MQGNFYQKFKFFYYFYEHACRSIDFTGITAFQTRFVHIFVFLLTTSWFRINIIVKAARIVIQGVLNE